MAATAAAPENREVVAEEPPAAIGEDRWKVGTTRPLLLTALDRRELESTAVRCHATADRGVVASGGIKLLVVTPEHPVPQCFDA